MNNTEKELEFDVLGFKIRFRPEEVQGQTPPAQIVECVSQEANIIRKKYPGLDSGQVAILTSLKIAERFLALNKEYQENIFKLQKEARDALQIIEEVSPNSN